MYGKWHTSASFLRICADFFCIELYDPVTLMFFFRNKHMMCDFGTGNNNKLNWVLEDKQELIDIIETIYRGAKKGRGLVVSPKGKSDCLLEQINTDCFRLLDQISILDPSQTQGWICRSSIPSRYINGEALNWAL